MMPARFGLLLAVVICGCHAQDSSGQGLEPKLQVIYQEIQWTLAKLHQGAGLQASELAKMAAKIADHIESYLTEVGAVIQKEDIKNLLTDLAEEFIHNFTSLTALFDDVMSLQAAKLDSAFVLLDKLSKMILSLADKQELYTVLTAIEKTAIAVHDVAAETSSLFHYLSNPKVTRSRRETTVSGHVEHGPQGTSGGVSVSHSWRRRR